HRRGFRPGAAGDPRVPGSAPCGYTPGQTPPARTTSAPGRGGLAPGALGRGPVEPGSEAGPRGAAPGVNPYGPHERPTPPIAPGRAAACPRAAGRAPGLARRPGPLRGWQSL